MASRSGCCCSGHRLSLTRRRSTSGRWQTCSQLQMQCYGSATLTIPRQRRIPQQPEAAFHNNTHKRSHASTNWKLPHHFLSSSFLKTLPDNKSFLKSLSMAGQAIHAAASAAAPPQFTERRSSTSHGEHSHTPRLQLLAGTSPTEHVPRRTFWRTRVTIRGILAKQQRELWPAKFRRVLSSVECGHASSTIITKFYFDLTTKQVPCAQDVSNHVTKHVQPSATSRTIITACRQASLK